jgi:pyruvate,water dikinase
VRVEVPEDRRERSCLDRPALEALVEVGRRVERYFGSAQDIEWAIARGGELPSSLFVLQTRPVTTMPKQSDQSKPTSAMALLMSTFGVGKSDDE